MPADILECTTLIAMESGDARLTVEVRDGVVSTFLSTLTSKDRTSVLAARAAEAVPTGGRLQLLEISSRCAHAPARPMRYRSSDSFVASDSSVARARSCGARAICSRRGMQVVMSYLRGSIETSAARRTLHALDEQIRVELVTFARGQRLDGLLALLERQWSRSYPHER